MVRAVGRCPVCRQPAPAQLRPAMCRHGRNHVPGHQGKPDCGHGAAPVPEADYGHGGIAPIPGGGLVSIAERGRGPHSGSRPAWRATDVGGGPEPPGGQREGALALGHGGASTQCGSAFGADPLPLVHGGAGRNGMAAGTGSPSPVSVAGTSPGRPDRAHGPSPTGAVRAQAFGRCSCNIRARSGLARCVLGRHARHSVAAQACGEQGQPGAPAYRLGPPPAADPSGNSALARLVEAIYARARQSD